MTYIQLRNHDTDTDRILGPFEVVQVTPTSIHTHDGEAWTTLLKSNPFGGWQALADDTSWDDAYCFHKDA